MKTSLALLLLFGLAAAAQQPATQQTTPPTVAAPSPVKPLAPLPGGGTRNAELQKRLEAEIAPSGAVWGVSVRHAERNEGAGVRELEGFQTASVFKVGVLMELFNQAREGKVRLDERVTWQNPEHYFGSGILVNLAPGLQPTWHDLAVLMITLSDNAATDTLCAKVGIPNINARLKSLGIQGFSIHGCTRDLILAGMGLDPAASQALTTRTLREALPRISVEERRARQLEFVGNCYNCSTPAAMTALLEKILAGQAADKSGTEEMLTILGRQQFNQRLPRYLDARVAHKTGSLTSPVWVVNDAGIIYLPNGEHVIVTVFGHGTEWEMNDAARKQSTAEAEDRIGRIGKLVYDFYAGR
jgi:beta-lactamase class A